MRCGECEYMRVRRGFEEGAFLLCGLSNDTHVRCEQDCFQDAVRRGALKLDIEFYGEFLARLQAQLDGGGADGQAQEEETNG